MKKQWFEKKTKNCSRRKKNFENLKKTNSVKLFEKNASTRDVSSTTAFSLSIRRTFQRAFQRTPRAREHRRCSPRVLPFETRSLWRNSGRRECVTTLFECLTKYRIPARRLTRAVVAKRARQIVVFKFPNLWKRECEITCGPLMMR